MQFNKQTELILLISVIIIWMLMILNIIYRWYFISSEIYVIVEFFIYLLSIISVIWGVTQVIRHHTIAINFFIFILITALIVPTITYLGYPDKVKLYMDFYLNHEARKEIAIKMVDNYNEAIKNQQKPKKELWLENKQKYLTDDGVVQMWTDRGCVEVDFKLYNGSGHEILDYFNYGKSGYITYVTDETKFNLNGATIRKIIHTEKITEGWYYVQAAY